MPLQLVRQDITRMQVDAIVNSANHQLRGGSGVNGAIHRAAGPGLMEECLTLGGCKTGEAKLTRAYDLPCRYVIHTVGPVWRGGLFGEQNQLAACYWRSLELAYRHGCQSVAFPLISSGVFGYPKDRALKTAVDAISAFLLQCEADVQVYLVLYSSDAMHTVSKLYADIQQFIDDHYVAQHTDPLRESQRARYAEESWQESMPAMEEKCAPVFYGECSAGASTSPYMPSSLEEALEHVDESFSQMVLRKIQEKGMKNADCYKKANLDKKHFSKISSDIHYRPKKTTALALAIALEMDLSETRELLMKAGLALSRSDRFDIIVEYFICAGRYDIFEINEALFAYDQPLLGCVIA